MIDQSASAVSKLHNCRRPEFFLTRLRRLVIQNWDPDLDDEQRRLVRKAIYSTYMDCRAMGIGEAALTIVAEVPGVPRD